ITGANFDELVLTAELEITPADIAGISFEDASFIYDGSDRSIEITGTLPAGTSVSYENNTRTNVGNQEATATITGSNFNTLVLTADLTITPADITGITLEDASFVFDGTVKTIEITGTLPDGASVSYTDNTQTNVGTQAATATITGSNFNTLVLSADLVITPADLSIIADEGQSKIFGTADPEFSFTTSGFVAGDSEEVLTGSLARLAGENVGTYPITLGNLSAGDNYQIQFISADFKIFPASIEVVIQPDMIETAWSINPELPATVTVMTVDGQFLELPVTWDVSALIVFTRGDYILTGTFDLPSGILNPEGLTAEIVVTVLPKSAPEDIVLDNNSFEPSINQNFIPIGAFNVVDPFDNQHDIILAGLELDNMYFEIIDGILFWSSAEKVDGRTEFNILVRVVDRDGNILQKEFTIRRTRPSVNDIEIFNTFTPNGDGVNDTWGIEQLRFYTGARIQVFERSGQRVFYTEDPDVRWDGTFQGRELPVGAYYWVIEVKETDEVRRGMLNLIRK
ncbi:MAG: hypothetical protein EA341_00065, partial [Mongoliibacter sp.]|uniref:T9SS type B sorting domain-containing protein n=1 Tax=Mongoliibacter sp. TaxID=2022438 RepID=UPI0012F00FEB